MFDSSACKIYGIPTLNDAYFYMDKVLEINLAAANGGPTVTSVFFNITVIGIQSPPLFIKPIPNQIAYVGQFFSFIVPNNIFNDSNPLTYSSTLSGNSISLPSWLTFDASSKNFYGTPGMSDTDFYKGRILRINVTAMNAGPIGTSTIFNINVNGMSYGQMAVTIAGSTLGVAVAAFTLYKQKNTIAHYIKTKIKTPKSWQFHEQTREDSDRGCYVYLIPENQVIQKAQGSLPAMVYDQTGRLCQLIIYNKGTIQMFRLEHLNLHSSEQELCDNFITKNLRARKNKVFLKAGDPVLNWLASKGDYAHQDYQLIPVPATSRDFAKVIEYYQHCPVPGYDIKSVEIIYNPTMQRAFADNLRILQGRHNNPAFRPRFDVFSLSDEEQRLSEIEQQNLRINLAAEAAWRTKTREMWETMAAPYMDRDNLQVKLLPLWHGTRPEILPSIFKAGFANLASTDSGYFGKGLYSTYEAEYSYKYYCKGALILNWVSSFSAYPVIAGDMKKLTSKGNFGNYDTHFIPVADYTVDNADGFVPESLQKFPAHLRNTPEKLAALMAQNPDIKVDDVFLPCAPNQINKYTEVVVFEKAQCLPRYLVTLQPTLIRSVIFNLTSFAVSTHNGITPPSPLTEEQQAAQKDKGIARPLLFSNSSQKITPLAAIPSSSSSSMSSSSSIPAPQGQNPYFASKPW
jgi:hypothetical protein